MMDLRSGLPYHWILNGLPFRYPKLEHDHRCEVVVVGGGITGALCAYACAKAGMGVTVVDAKSIATGSTSASTALLQYEIDTPLRELAQRIGMTDAVRNYQVCLEAIHDLRLLAEETGATLTHRKSVQYASTRADARGLQEEHALRAANGFRVELLAPGDLKTLFGFQRPAALLSHEAAEMDPYAFTHALLQEVLRMGGQVFDRTSIEHLERDGPTHRLRTGDGARILAKTVVMATGYESQRYLPGFTGVDLHSTYALASERMPMDILWYEQCLIWETAMPYLYLRTTPDGRAIIGGLDEPFRDPRKRDALLPRKTRRLTKAFKKLFPHLPFQAEYAWCGTFGSTKDGLPYIDRDPRTGAWFVLGMGGNGITFSQVGARIVRDTLLGRPSPDARLFAFDR